MLDTEYLLSPNILFITSIAIILLIAMYAIIYQMPSGIGYKGYLLSLVLLLLLILLTYSYVIGYKQTYMVLAILAVFLLIIVVVVITSVGDKFNVIGNDTYLVVSTIVGGLFFILLCFKCSCQE